MKLIFALDETTIQSFPNAESQVLRFLLSRCFGIGVYIPYGLQAKSIKEHLI